MTQTITGLPAGRYSLSAVLRGNSKVPMKLTASSGNDSQQAKFAGTGTTASGNLPMGWQKVSVPAIYVNKGEELIISLTASGASWWSADNFQLTLVEPDPTGIGSIHNSQFTIHNSQSSMVNGQSVYDLTGRRVKNSQFTIHNSSQSSGAGGTQLKKGIYIVRGKKVVIRNK